MKNKKPAPIVRFAAAQFSDQAWRLNNLYYIVDKSGRRVRFSFNWAQRELYNNLHTQNIILKARQLGMSTFVSLYMLDRCIFKKDVRAGSVAHDMASARGLFRDKIKFPFENLPEQLRNVRAPLNDFGRITAEQQQRAANCHLDAFRHAQHAAHFGIGKNRCTLSGSGP